jgi:uncharacterized protein
MRSLAVAVGLLWSAFDLAQAPQEPREAWAGRWRAEGGKLHATLALTEVTPAGFAVEWDEGVGDQGLRAKGAATWITGGRARFKSAGCTLTLARGTGDTLTATVAAESCFNWASPAKLTFVREEAAAAAADCTKATTPIERAVCADPDLAAAEQRLAAVQREKLGRHGGGIAATERRYLDRRNARCADEQGQRDCLMREYGRRLLELRAWPAPPFDPATGRPELGVLRAILRDDAAREASGINELVAGLVGGAPGAIQLTLDQDDEGIWLSGCDRVDGTAPQAPDCPRAHYIAFLKNGETWAARTHDKEITVAPSPAKDQALPASLHAFARGPEKVPPPR